MTRGDYLNQQETLFTQMEAHRGSKRIPLGLGAAKTLHITLAWAGVASCIGVGAGLGYEISHFFPVVALGGVLGALSGLSLAVSEGTQPCALFKAASGVMHKVGIASVPSPEQAERIASLCEQHPRIAQACVKWATENSKQALTTREYAVIEKTVKRLEKLEDRWSASETNRLQAEAALTILNRNGLLDHAVSCVQSSTLDTSTTMASGMKSSRRI